jgi:hypothetical protein
MSEWTRLRVSVQNLRADTAQVRVAIGLDAATTQPAQAMGGHCDGSAAGLDCDLTIDAAGAATLAVPARWNGPGKRSIEVRAKVVSPSTTASDAITTSTVSIYLLELLHLKTSPSPARAGRNFVGTATLVRSDTREPVSAYSLRCPAVIAVVPNGQPLSVLRGEGARREAHLRCLWRLPKNAAGRFVRALILARSHSGGMQTKYPFVRRVR